jgi:hypothetical protein
MCLYFHTKLLNFLPLSTIICLTAAYVKMWLTRHVTICNLSPAKENKIIRPCIGKVLPSHTTKHIKSGRVNVEFCASLNLLLNGSQWLDSHPRHFISGENPLQPTQQEGGWGPEPVWMLQRRQEALPLPDQMIS